MLESLRTYEAASSRTDVPIGIRVSAIILVLLACALALCGLFCLIAFVISLIHHGRGLATPSLFLGGTVLCATSLVCFRAATALQSGRLWGAIVGTVCGGLAVSLGRLLVFDLFNPRRHSPDEYFLYPVAPIFLLLGAWLCLYLSRPHVRSLFRQSSPQ